MPAKGVLGDAMGKLALSCTGICYFAVFLILVIVGAAVGPEPIVYSASPQGDPNQLCPDPSACVVTWVGSLTEMTPQHQTMWLSVTLDRPFELVSHKPALLGYNIPVMLTYQLDVQGVQADGTATQLTFNSTHSTRTFCRAADLSCSEVTIFRQPLITFPTYRLTVRFLNPTQPFAAAPLDGYVHMHVRMGFISRAYTNFELGIKMFFVVTSAMFWLAYVGSLFFGPGTKDPQTGKRLHSTYEQSYVAWLGFFLILFNDPFVALSVDDPSVQLAGFTAFSVTTFLTSLLLFWLFMFDLARLQGEGGIDLHLDPGTKRLGFCFWFPKVIWGCIFWSISLAGYVWTRYYQLQDPGYNPIESLASQGIAVWFSSFIAALLAYYLLYIFALLVLTCRNCGTMRPANRFVTGVTFFTIVVSLVGLFLNSFTPSLHSDGALFLAVYGAPNLYIWLLMFAFIPSPHWAREILAVGEDGGADGLEARNNKNNHHNRSEGQVGGGGGEQYTADTEGVLGGAEGGDEVRPEDLQVFAPTTTTTIVDDGYDGGDGRYDNDNDEEGGYAYGDDEGYAQQPAPRRQQQQVMYKNGSNNNNNNNRMMVRETRPVAAAPSIRGGASPRGSQQRSAVNGNDKTAGGNMVVRAAPRGGSSSVGGGGQVVRGGRAHVAPRQQMQPQQQQQQQYDNYDEEGWGDEDASSNNAYQQSKKRTNYQNSHSKNAGAASFAIEDEEEGADTGAAQQQGEFERGDDEGRDGNMNTRVAEEAEEDDEERGQQQQQQNQEDYDEGILAEAPSVVRSTKSGAGGGKVLGMRPVQPGRVVGGGVPGRK